ncbi:hypothetical protein [Pseudomonas sp. dw_612]|uniref:hypothetical protein n=1 Tax=Pseudomonas sp. dw_612 TaxID=2720080 RepID=UPI001BD2C071|nr:hypothetical protein [Pseudomonas sp. dw_612]
MPTIDKRVAVPKPKQNGTTGLGVTKNFYQALAHRTPRDAIEKNFQLLDESTKLIDKKTNFNRLKKEIENDIKINSEPTNKIEVLWINHTLGLAKNPYEYFYHASLTLTIMATLAVEEGETEKAWSYIAEALFLSGALAEKEVAIIRQEKNQSKKTSKSTGGIKAAKRHDAIKLLIKELLTTKRSTSKWTTARDAVNSILGEVQSSEEFTLSGDNADKTIRKWIIHDDMFKEFGFKF